MQKFGRSACSEIDGNNFSGAHKQIFDGIAMASKYLAPDNHAYQIAPYQPKHGQPSPQKKADGE
jgi:hypothetical protein